MKQLPTATAAEIKISFVGAEAGTAFDALELDREEGRSRAVHFWDRPVESAGGAIALPLLDRGSSCACAGTRPGRGPNTRRT